MSHIVTTPSPAGNDKADSSKLDHERRRRRKLKRQLSRAEYQIELLKDRLAQALDDADQWESHAHWLAGKKTRQAPEVGE